MTKTAIFDPLTPAHLDGAVALSHAEGWPHRPEDWALILGLSRGIAALDGDRLVGTAMATPFEPAGTLNMIVVARDWRGRGLARAMLERLMDGDARQWRLIATADGLPLYEKLGFVETHRIVQQQGPVAAVAAPEGVAWAEPGDTEVIAALDRAATGMDRAGLVAALASAGRFAVIRDTGGLAGYAALRRFGRGEVAGRSSPATPPTRAACSPSCSPAARAPSSVSTPPRRAASATGSPPRGLSRSAAASP
jgi:GNAT superfamily N-acetyltransferase